MKVVFLDIDGVLNSHAYLSQKTAPTHADGSPRLIYDAETWVEMLDPACVERLTKIVDATGAAIVVSSSWRHGRRISWFREILGARGFRGDIGKTPDHVPNGDPLSTREVGQRGDEIWAWLNRMGQAYEVDSFVVLDDNSDMDAVRDRFVQTSMAVGLTDADVGRAIEILGRPL